MANSLVVANTIELLGGGVPSVIPSCAGAIFRLAPGWDLGRPEPSADFVASLILDGSRPVGRRSDNRQIKLPVLILAPDGQTLAAAREQLQIAVDQDRFTLTWTRDPEGGTPLPLLIDCFRATATNPGYDLPGAAQHRLAVEITLTALPYGRSDQQTRVAFAAPVPAASPPPPPAPVVLDVFSAINSPVHYQSQRCVIGPQSLCWDPDDDRIRDPGGQNSVFTYAAQLAVTQNLTGLTGLQMYLGFGTRYYHRLEYHGHVHGVTVTVTLTDSSGASIEAQRTGLRLPVSPNWGGPAFSRISMPIPLADPVFNYQAVVSYALTIVNRHAPRSLRWVTCYVDNLSAQPPSVAASPVTRGTVYTLHGVMGTARAPASLSFIQPPGPGTPTTLSTPGVGNYTVPAGAAWLKVEGIGSGGPGGTQTVAGVAAGGSGAEYAREDVFPCIPGQLIPYSVPAAASPGSNGGPAVFGPAPGASLVLIVNGGKAATQNSPAGPPGGTGSQNAVRFPGGAGRTASGSVGGGGGSSAGFASPGLTPTGTAAVLYQTAGTTPWVCPAGVYLVFAEVWGSGASGATGSSSTNGSGGGAGEYAAGYIAVTPGNSYNVVIAAGGVAVSGSAQNGNAGGSCSFTGDAGAQILAHGGARGVPTWSGGGGLGGDGSSAPVHFPGGRGGPADPYSGSGGSSAGPSSPGNTGSGYGGTTPAPSGGGQGGSGSGANNNNGAAGQVPGGGGGGTYGAVTSGAGAVGQVRLTYPGGVGAPTNSGAAAVPGGGAGGNGGNTPGATPTNGQQPGGAGGGACSSGTTVPGGLGGAGQLKVTPYTAQPVKNVLAHRPPPGAPKNFQPLVSVGAGADPPDGTHQYTMPAPVAGVTADFGGTYTFYLVASSWAGGSSSTTPRTIFITITQWEYPGGPAYPASTVPVVIAPSQVVNGLVTAGVLTLPQRPVAPDNTAGYYSASVTSSNTGDRFADLIAVDSMGQTLVINGSAGYIQYWADAPNPDVDLGLLLGSQTDRTAAISVVDGNTILTGGTLHLEPSEGDNQLFCYSTDGVTPNVAVSYYPAWFYDRLG